MDVLQFRGSTSPFIAPLPGAPSHNLFKMANSEIISDLRIAIHAAKKQKKAILKNGLNISVGRLVYAFNLRVIPLVGHPSEKNNFYLIQFEDAAEKIGNLKTKKRSTKNKSTTTKKDDSYIYDLQQELATSHEYQQSIINKYETAQEDLTVANEELQSANEELQSTNEELETAKEELQSGNEELATVNEELKARSIEQSHTNNDLINLLGSAQIPIVMLDNSRKIRRFTPLAGKVLNLLASDIGRPLAHLKLNFRTPDSDLNLENLISDVVESMEPREMEVQDHQKRWFRLQVKPYKTLDGKIDGAVLALVDINDLKHNIEGIKAAKLEADKANRAKDLFLATLSHELRTPLTAILSWAQMIQSGKLDAEKIKHGGQVIEDCGKSQARLIDDLLDVSRIIMGKVSLEMVEIDPRLVLLKAIESARFSANQKSIQIESSFDKQAGTVVGDASRLQQVFLNLLTNAIKFSSPHSIVSVILTKDSDALSTKAKILIQVKDSGKGIQADFLPRIFDAFSQEDNSSIRVHGGLGLGLAIVRSLVELHGGSVNAESPGENLGAIFTIALPMKTPFALGGAQAVDQEVPGEQKKLKVRVNLDGIRVLLVDDDQRTREAFLHILETFGAQVKTASSAASALEEFKLRRPDVLVSDIAMPDEDGYSLIRKIRALPLSEGGAVPAVAVTAHAGEEDRKHALSCGFQFYLSKPVNSIHFAELISLAASKKS